MKTNTLVSCFKARFFALLILTFWSFSDTQAAPFVIHRLPADTPETVRAIPVTDSPLVNVAPPESVREEIADSLHDKIKRKIKAPIIQIPVTAHSLIIPSIFVGYGVLSLNFNALKDVNVWFKDQLWQPGQKQLFSVEDYFTVAPIVAVYAMNFAGYKGMNNIVDRSIMLGMANLISNGLVFGVKSLGYEERPDKSNRYSFPSGHTAQAFVSAEFARLEYRGGSPWVGIGAYAMAVSTAVLRMYNNKHWFGDVVAGAGLGIVSTRFAYYIYPSIKKRLFGARKIRETTNLFPSSNGMGGYGLTFSYQFP
jgi:membrane-associated phospholipid phosphatase